MRCTTLCCSIAIVFASACIRADSKVADLTQVHRVAVIGAPPQRLHELEHTLDRNIPDVQLASAEDADLLIDYSEATAEGTRPGEIKWVVSLSRLDCQSPEFGVPPRKPSDGPCERRVFTRTDLGSMDGVVGAREGGVGEFVARLRQAIVAPLPQNDVPPAEMPPPPPPQIQRDLVLQPDVVLEPDLVLELDDLFGPPANAVP